jgi:glycosyltransferase involved in cell wall biosynthesis
LQAQPSDRSGIIYVGQLTQRKGISYLIDSYHKVNASCVVDLKIIGRDTGQMATKLSKLRLPIHSHMNQTSLNEAMLHSKYFLLPSLAEGFGLSALEAMATGLIVIISNRTFGNDIITDGVNGYVFDPRDTVSVANIILEIERDLDLASRLSEAAVHSAKQLTWETYRQKVFSIIRSKLKYS